LNEMDGETKEQPQAHMKTTPEQTNTVQPAMPMKGMGLTGAQMKEWKQMGEMNGETKEQPQAHTKTTPEQTNTVQPAMPMKGMGLTGAQMKQLKQMGEMDEISHSDLQAQKQAQEKLRKMKEEAKATAKANKKALLKTKYDAEERITMEDHAQAKARAQAKAETREQARAAEKARLNAKAKAQDHAREAKEGLSAAQEKQFSALRKGLNSHAIQAPEAHKEPPQGHTQGVLSKDQEAAFSRLEKDDPSDATQEKAREARAEDKTAEAKNTEGMRMGLTAAQEKQFSALRKGLKSHAITPDQEEFKATQAEVGMRRESGSEPHEIADTAPVMDEAKKVTSTSEDTDAAPADNHHFLTDNQNKAFEDLNKQSESSEAVETTPEQDDTVTPVQAPEVHKELPLLSKDQEAAFARLEKDDPAMATVLVSEMQTFVSKSNVSPLTHEQSNVFRELKASMAKNP